MRPLERRFRAMNADMRLALHPRDPAAGARALVAAEERIREIEARFSRFLPTSELSALNASAGERVRVSADMRVVLALALALHDETEGVFDPTVLPDLERAGYDRSFELVRDVAAPGPRRPRPAFRELELRGEDVRLAPGMRLDLGGIAKGWAADLVADDLAAYGPALVDLGGDVALRGTPPEGAWAVGVERPDHAGALLSVLALGEGGVATSGTNRRRWRAGEREMHHVVDPRTGDPARTDLVQVTALHARTARADVWAKTALVVGSGLARSFVATHAGLELLLVPREGDPIASRGLLDAARRTMQRDGAVAALA